VLSWITSDATAVTLNQGIGSVALSGVNGVSPIVTTTYTLTATGPGGVVTCADTVMVTPAPIVVTPLPVCDAFTTAPSSMSDAGPVSLVWDTSLATIVTIDNGVGNVVLDGSTNVNVAADTTFTLTATNGAQSVTCQASVDISATPVVPPVVPGGGGGNGGGGSNSPRCELTASNQNIKPGDSVNLSWKNSNTNDLLLVNNFGNTLIDTRRSTTIDEDAGSIRVSPSRTTTYTLTAIRGSRDRECTVTVSVISLSSNRMQDSISLSKTPYTGFEAGAALTFIFYAGIVLWGLTVAYVLVMKNNPTIFTRTTSGAAPIKSYETAPLNELDFTLGSTFLPHNLPTEELEHSEQIDDVHTETDSISLLEERAHEQYALISSDALRLIEGQSGVTEDQVETLDRVIALAKARYPKENEWIVINKERVMSLLS
jgi:hypothetical protein